jgi:hypothetical protein
MKNALRLGVLILCVFVGLWAIGRGITLIVAVRIPGQADVLEHLLGGSVFVAGGVCVLSVAIAQLVCWRTHGRNSGLL